MSVSNMHHKRLPLCQNQLLKPLFGACGTPVQMSSNSFYPVCYFFITLLLASLHQFFSDGSGHVPYIIKMTGFGMVFTDPLRNAVVSVGYKHRNCKALLKE